MMDAIMIIVIILIGVWLLLAMIGFVISAHERD